MPHEMRFNEEDNIHSADKMKQFGELQLKKYRFRDSSTLEEFKNKEAAYRQAGRAEDLEYEMGENDKRFAAQVLVEEENARIAALNRAEARAKQAAVLETQGKAAQQNLRQKIEGYGTDENENAAIYEQAPAGGLYDVAKKRRIGARPESVAAASESTSVFSSEEFEAARSRPRNGASYANSKEETMILNVPKEQPKKKPSWWDRLRGATG